MVSIFLNAWKKFKEDIFLSANYIQFKLVSKNKSLLEYSLFAYKLFLAMFVLQGQQKLKIVNKRDCTCHKA